MAAARSVVALLSAADLQDVEELFLPPARRASVQAPRRRHNHEHSDTDFHSEEEPKAPSAEDLVQCGGLVGASYDRAGIHSRGRKRMGQVAKTQPRGNRSKPAREEKDIAGGSVDSSLPGLCERLSDLHHDVTQINSHLDCLVEGRESASQLAARQLQAHSSQRSSSDNIFEASGYVEELRDLMLRLKSQLPLVAALANDRDPFEVMHPACGSTARPPTELHAALLEERQLTTKYRHELLQSEARQATLSSEAKEARGAAEELFALLETGDQRTAQLEANFEAIKTSQDRSSKAEVDALKSELAQNQRFRSRELKVSERFLQGDVKKPHGQLDRLKGFHNEDSLPNPQAVNGEPQSSLTQALAIARSVLEKEEMTKSPPKSLKHRISETHALETEVDSLRTELNAQAEQLRKANEENADRFATPELLQEMQEMEESHESACHLEERASNLALHLNMRLQEQCQRADVLETLAESMVQDLARERTGSEKACCHAIACEEVSAKHAEHQLEHELELLILQSEAERRQSEIHASELKQQLQERTIHLEQLDREMLENRNAKTQAVEEKNELRLQLGSALDLLEPLRQQSDERLEAARSWEMQVDKAEARIGAEILEAKELQRRLKEAESFEQPGHSVSSYTSRDTVALSSSTLSLAFDSTLDTTVDVLGGAGPLEEARVWENIVNLLNSEIAESRSDHDRMKSEMASLREHVGVVLSHEEKDATVDPLGVTGLLEQGRVWETNLNLLNSEIAQSRSDHDRVKSEMASLRDHVGVVLSHEESTIAALNSEIAQSRSDHHRVKSEMTSLRDHVGVVLSHQEMDATVDDFGGAGSLEQARAWENTLTLLNSEVAESRSDHDRVKSEMASLQDHVVVVLSHEERLSNALVVSEENADCLQADLRSELQCALSSKAAGEVVQADLLSELQGAFSKSVAAELGAYRAQADLLSELQELQSAVSKRSTAEFEARRVQASLEQRLELQATESSGHAKTADVCHSATKALETQLMAQQLESEAAARQMKVLTDEVAAECARASHSDQCEKALAEDVQVTLSEFMECRELQLGHSAECEVLTELLSERMADCLESPEAELLIELDEQRCFNSLLQDEFGSAASRTLDLTDELNTQLDEEKKRVESLELWVGSLTRELAVERERSEDLLQHALASDQQASACSVQEEVLCRVFDEHQRCAGELESHVEAHASHLSTQLLSRLDQQHNRAAHLQSEVEALASELAGANRFSDERTSQLHLQHVEQLEGQACIHAEQLEQSYLEVKRAAELSTQLYTRLDHLQSRTEQFEGQITGLAQDMTDARQSQEVQSIEARSLEESLGHEMTMEAEMHRRASACEKAEVEASRFVCQVSERNAQLEELRDSEELVAAGLQRTLEQQWRRSEELEATVASLGDQLRFQLTDTQEHLHDQLELEQKLELGELEHKLKIEVLEQSLAAERQRAARQEGALRSEAEDSDAIAEDLREQLKAQQSRNAQLIADAARYAKDIWGFQEQPPLERGVHGPVDPWRWESNGVACAPSVDTTGSGQHHQNGHLRRSLSAMRCTHHSQMRPSPEIARHRKRIVFWGWWTMCCTLRFAAMSSSSTSVVRDVELAVEPCMKQRRHDTCIILDTVIRLRAWNSCCPQLFGTYELLLRLALAAFRLGVSGSVSRAPRKEEANMACSNNPGLARYLTALSGVLTATAMSELFKTWLCFAVSVAAARAASKVGTKAVGQLDFEVHTLVEFRLRRLRGEYVSILWSREARCLLRGCLALWYQPCVFKETTGHRSALAVRALEGLLLRRSQLATCQLCIKQWLAATRLATLEVKLVAAMEGLEYEKNCQALQLPLGRPMVHQPEASPIRGIRSPASSPSHGMRSPSAYSVTAALCSSRRRATMHECLRYWCYIVKALHSPLRDSISTAIMPSATLEESHRRVRFMPSSPKSRMKVSHVTSALWNLRQRAALRECLRAWYYIVQVSTCRFQLCGLASQCCEEAEWHRDEVCRLREKATVMMKIVKEAPPLKQGDRVEVLPMHGQQLISVASIAALALIGQARAPALALWARLCVFAWHHVITARSLGRTFVSNSIAMCADRSLRQAFHYWHLVSVEERLMQHGKQGHLPSLRWVDPQDVLEQLDAVDLRTPRVYQAVLLPSLLGAKGRHGPM